MEKVEESRTKLDEITKDKDEKNKIKEEKITERKEI